MVPLSWASSRASMKSSDASCQPPTCCAWQSRWNCGGNGCCDCLFCWNIPASPCVSATPRASSQFKQLLPQYGLAFLRILEIVAVKTYSPHDRLKHIHDCWLFCYRSERFRTCSYVVCTQLLGLWMLRWIHCRSLFLWLYVLTEVEYCWSKSDKPRWFRPSFSDYRWSMLSISFWPRLHRNISFGALYRWRRFLPSE